MRLAWSTIPAPAVTVWNWLPVQLFWVGTTPVATNVAAACAGKIVCPPGFGGPGDSWFKTHVAVSAFA